MTLLQQNLQRAGIGLMLCPVAASQYLGRDGPLRTGSFDVAIYGVAYGRDPDLAADWSCNRRPPRGGNFTRWCDPALTEPCERDAKVRRCRGSTAVYRSFRSGIRYEDVGASRDVVGFTPPSARVPMTYSCDRWSLAS